MTGEGIRRNKETISQEFRDRWDSVKEPVKRIAKAGTENTLKTPGNSQNRIFYEGETPTLGFIECSTHGQTEIKDIGTGIFQTDCLCRWALEQGTDKIICLEVEGLRVRQQLTKKEVSDFGI